jgi:predicted dehydrogenase
MAGTSGASRREFLGGVMAAGALAAGGNALAADVPASQPASQPAMQPDHPKPAPWQPISDRKIRVGIVGGGFGAQFHWHQHPNCTVEAVSDLQPALREGLMKTYGCQKSYESLEKLIEDDNIEAVAIFTDAPSHGKHVQACMAHGKHVISAVPAGVSLDDLAAIKAAKEKSGLQYMMAETTYFRRPTIEARNIYRTGRKLLYTEGQYYHDKVTLLPSFHNWRYALPPMLYPTHAVGFYVAVSGKRLTRVSCLGHRGVGEQWQTNQWDNNPFACESALFETSEQTMCRINVFWECDPNSDGETGSWIWQAEGAEHVPDQVSIPPGMSYGGHGGSHGPLVNEFLTALIEKRNPAVNMKEALSMTAPGIVAHHSALKDGEQLPIPQYD